MERNFATFVLVGILLIYLAFAFHGLIKKADSVANTQVFSGEVRKPVSPWRLDSELPYLSLVAVAVSSLVGWQLFSGIVQFGESAFDRDDDRWSYWIVIAVESVAVVSTVLFAIFCSWPQ